VHLEQAAVRVLDGQKPSPKRKLALFKHIAAHLRNNRSERSMNGTLFAMNCYAFRHRNGDDLSVEVA